MLRGAWPVHPVSGRRYRHGVDRRFLRPGWIAGHVLVFLAFLTCLRLGWWQWERTQETTGTAQNFGYALLWPAFGVAFIYMWVRFLRLEVIKDAEDDEETDRALAALLAVEDVAPAADVPLRIKRTPIPDKPRPRRPLRTPPRPALPPVRVQMKCRPKNEPGAGSARPRP